MFCNFVKNKNRIVKNFVQVTLPASRGRHNLPAVHPSTSEHRGDAPPTDGLLARVSRVGDNAMQNAERGRATTEDDAAPKCADAAGNSKSFDGSPRLRLRLLELSVVF